MSTTVTTAKTTVAFLLIAVESAIAQDTDLVTRGRDIAARCARCHAVETVDVSPQAITPPFRELWRRYPIAMLVEAAKSGTIEGHDEMPEFVFDDVDMTALLAYIDSLNPSVAGYAGLVGKR